MATTTLGHHVHHPVSLARTLLAAVVSGQIAGLIMAVAMMLVFTLFLGKNPLYPVQVIGSFAYGDAALVGIHVPAVIAGLLLHQLGPTLIWSLIFGALVYASEIRGGIHLLVLALAVGGFSQIIDVDIALPAAMVALHGHDIWAEQVPALWSWIAHLVFGVGLMLYPKLQPRLLGQPRRPET
jgi:hypothetical protein